MSPRRRVTVHLDRLLTRKRLCRERIAAARAFGDEAERERWERELAHVERQHRDILDRLRSR